MFGPVQLTHLIYVVIPIIFVCVVCYMIWYNVQQKKKLREAERSGARPQSVEAEILMAQQQTKMDEEREKK
jgi:hypothetical protein